MKDGFAPGISDEMTITTTPDMGVTHLGPGVPSMYSTPSTVSLIEAACVLLVTRYVGPGEQSVGVRIDVKRLAPTAVGKRVTAAVLAFARSTAAAWCSTWPWRARTA